MQNNRQTSGEMLSNDRLALSIASDEEGGGGGGAPGGWWVGGGVTVRGTAEEGCG